LNTKSRPTKKNSALRQFLTDNGGKFGFETSSGKVASVSRNRRCRIEALVVVDPCTVTRGMCTTSSNVGLLVRDALTAMKNILPAKTATKAYRMRGDMRSERRGGGR